MSGAVYSLCLCYNSNTSIVVQTINSTVTDRIYQNFSTFYRNTSDVMHLCLQKAALNLFSSSEFIFIQIYRPSYRRKIERSTVVLYGIFKAVLLLSSGLTTVLLYTLYPQPAY